jgi:hypothetical protein
LLLSVCAGKPPVYIDIKTSPSLHFTTYFKVYQEILSEVVMPLFIVRKIKHTSSIPSIIVQHHEPPGQ